MTIRTLRRLRFWSQLVIAAGLLFLLAVQYLWPWGLCTWHADEYRRLVVECDQAMHDEAALRMAELPADKAQLLRTTGDVGLMACHEYDKLRKRLLIAGVSEHRLSLLGLEGLEVERIPVSRMVEPHRMPRF